MNITSNPQPSTMENREQQQQHIAELVDRRKRARLQLIEPVAEDDANDDIPKAFQCPITREVMFDPVLDSEGNTYERAALLTWLSDHHTSPVSRQPLSQRTITPNNALRETIHEFMGEAWVKKCQKETPKEKLKDAADENSKLRAKIDSFLRHTSRDMGGLELQLNDEGCCAFRYDSITIVLDVPANVGIFCLYTKGLVPFVPNCQRDELHKRALELNFLQGETRGGCLAIRRSAMPSNPKNAGGEVMFSYTDRVAEISAHDFANILLNFVETSVALRDKLMFGFEHPLSMVEPDELWEEEEEEEELELALEASKTDNSNDSGNQQPMAPQA